MFDKVSQMAEQAATGISRREFLGKLGRGAMVAAATVGGILALPAVSHAGHKPRLCGAGSVSGCVGQYEGYPCSEERASGVCQGAKPRGDKSTVTVCGCTAEAPR